MKKILCVLAVLLSLTVLFACEGKKDPDAEESKSYAFTSGNVTVKIDAPADAILSALGEPAQYSESPSCAFDGLDKVYVYAGFRVQTYPLEGKDHIHSVVLTDDSVATAEGVTIGAERAAVIAAYGTPSSETDTALTYPNGDGATLQFLLRDGKVTSIQYLKSE